VEQPRGGPSRRLLLLGGGAVVVTGGLAALVANGLRLDLPEPPPPVPTRRRAPDEQLLVAVIRDLDELAERWPTASKPAALEQCHDLVDEQRRVIVGRLTNEGVPTEEITGRPMPSAAARQPLTPPRLAERLAALPETHLDATTSASAGTRGLLSAAYGTVLTCAGLLGEEVAPKPEPTPVRAALAERTSPLVYAFEVVAAQSTGTQRRRALEALDRLRRLDRLVAQSGTAGGWSLPHPVTDQRSARRLGDTVLSRAISAASEVLGDSPTRESIIDVARWLAALQLAAAPWGLAPEAFPGLEA
jgi:hypothetical protein